MEEKMKYLLTGFVAGIIIGIMVFLLLVNFRIINLPGMGRFPRPENFTGMGNFTRHMRPPV
jgi:hypothetical protein